MATKKSNWKNLIKTLATVKGYKIHSFEGIGLDYKAVYIKNPVLTGVFTYSGENYKSIYNQMMKNLNNYGTLAR